MLDPEYPHEEWIADLIYSRWLDEYADTGASVIWFAAAAADHTTNGRHGARFVYWFADGSGMEVAPDDTVHTYYPSEPTV